MRGQKLCVCMCNMDVLYEMFVYIVCVWYIDCICGLLCILYVCVYVCYLCLFSVLFCFPTQYRTLERHQGEEEEEDRGNTRMKSNEQVLKLNKGLQMFIIIFFQLLCNIFKIKIVKICLGKNIAQYQHGGRISALPLVLCVPGQVNCSKSHSLL